MYSNRLLRYCPKSLKALLLNVFCPDSAGSSQFSLVMKRQVHFDDSIDE